MTLARVIRRRRSSINNLRQLVRQQSKGWATKRREHKRGDQRHRTLNVRRLQLATCSNGPASRERSSPAHSQATLAEPNRVRAGPQMRSSNRCYHPCRLRQMSQMKICCRAFGNLAGARAKEARMPMMIHLLQRDTKIQVHSGRTGE